MNNMEAAYSNDSLNTSTHLMVHRHTQMRHVIGSEVLLRDSLNNNSTLSMHMHNGLFTQKPF